MRPLRNLTVAATTALTSAVAVLAAPATASATPDGCSGYVRTRPQDTITIVSSTGQNYGWAEWLYCTSGSAEHQQWVRVHLSTAINSNYTGDPGNFIGVHLSDTGRTDVRASQFCRSACSLLPGVYDTLSMSAADRQLCASMYAQENPSGDKHSGTPIFFARGGAYAEFCA